MSKRFLISEEEKKHILSLYEQRISDLPQNQQSTTPKPNLSQTPKTKDLRTTLSPQQQQQVKDITRGQKDLSKIYYGEMSPVNKPANVVKKVRLIFPRSKWEEIGLYLLKQFNIFTGFFRSLGEALNIVDDMAKNGVKTEELVIGSHGGGEQLLMTQKEGSFTFNNSFLEKIKQIVSPTTKVFFTACHGADYLEVLKDASEKLGVGAYASSGVYNYVTNESEKGFYYCSPQEYQKPTRGEVINPIKTFDRGGDIQVSFLSPVKPEKIIYTINTDIFGPPIRITKVINNPETKYYITSKINKGQYFVIEYIDLEYVIKNYIEYEMDNKDENYSKLFNSYRNQMSITPEMGGFLSKKFTEGAIQILFNTGINNFDVKSLKPFQLPAEVDNEFLLEKGLCRKVNGSPVSWFESVD